MNRPESTASLKISDQEGNYSLRNYNTISLNNASDSNSVKRADGSHPGGSMKKMRLSYLSPKGPDQKLREKTTKKTEAIVISEIKFEKLNLPEDKPPQ